VSRTPPDEPETTGLTAEELLAEFGADRGLDATTEPVVERILLGEWPIDE
jgi:hypothetical protein